MTAASTAGALQIVPGRECGSCSLCCKVYDIVEIGKAAGKWCGQCKPGRGCKIHDNLPNQCAEFNCLWRTDAAMPAQWKPDQAKMVASIQPITRNIQIQVDPGLPSAWSRQPYHDHRGSGRRRTCRKAFTSWSSSMTRRPSCCRTRTCR